MKNLFSCVVALTLMALVLPVTLPIAVLIKLTAWTGDQIKELWEA